MTKPTTRAVRGPLEIVVTFAGSDGQAEDKIQFKSNQIPLVNRRPNNQKKALS